MNTLLLTFTQLRDWAIFTHMNLITHMNVFSNDKKVNGKSFKISFW